MQPRPRPARAGPIPWRRALAGLALVVAVLFFATRLGALGFLGAGRAALCGAIAEEIRSGRHGARRDAVLLHLNDRALHAEAPSLFLARRGRRRTASEPGLTNAAARRALGARRRRIGPGLTAWSSRCRLARRPPRWRSSPSAILATSFRFVVDRAPGPARRAPLLPRADRGRALRAARLSGAPKRRPTAAARATQRASGRPGRGPAPRPRAGSPREGTRRLAAAGSCSGVFLVWSRGARAVNPRWSCRPGRSCCRSVRSASGSWARSPWRRRASPTVAVGENLIGRFFAGHGPRPARSYYYAWQTTRRFPALDPRSCRGPWRNGPRRLPPKRGKREGGGSRDRWPGRRPPGSLSRRSGSACAASSSSALSAGKRGVYLLPFFPRPRDPGRGAPRRAGLDGDPGRSHPTASPAHDDDHSGRQLSWPCSSSLLFTLRASPSAVAHGEVSKTHHDGGGGRTHEPPGNPIGLYQHGSRSPALIGYYGGRTRRARCEDEADLRAHSRGCARERSSWTAPRSRRLRRPTVGPGHDRRVLLLRERHFAMAVQGCPSSSPAGRIESPQWPSKRLCWPRVSPRLPSSRRIPA